MEVVKPLFSLKVRKYLERFTTLWCQMRILLHSLARSWECPGFTPRLYFSGGLRPDGCLRPTTSKLKSTVHINALALRVSYPRDAFVLVCCWGALARSFSGCVEEDKALELTRKLGVRVHRSMVVLSHSPMRCLAEQYSEKRVMVLGSSAKQIAEEDLGLRDTVSAVRAVP